MKIDNLGIEETLAKHKNCIITIIKKSNLEKSATSSVCTYYDDESPEQVIEKYLQIIENILKGLLK